MLPMPFRQIDLTTVSLICIFLENGIWFSFFLALISGGLLDSMSAVKPGFFLLFFLTSIIIINISSKFFVFENLSNKVIIFLSLFLLKFLLIYFLIDDSVISIFNFIADNYLQFIISVAVFFGIVNIIGTFKNIFDNEQHWHHKKSYLKSVR